LNRSQINNNDKLDKTCQDKTRLRAVQEDNRENPKSERVGNRKGAKAIANEDNDERSSFITPAIFDMKQLSHVNSFPNV